MHYFLIKVINRNVLPVMKKAESSRFLYQQDRTFCNTFISGRKFTQTDI